MGLAQISWLPHEQRAIQEESRLRQLDRRTMVRSEEEIVQSSMLKIKKAGCVSLKGARAAVQMLVPA